MLFNSFEFLFAFLPLTLLIVYSLRRLRAFEPAVLALIALSLAFYAWWDWRFVGLLLASAAFNWAIARRLDASLRASSRRLVLWIGIATNLGVLAYFKYALFFTDLLALRFGNSSSYVWLLPLGISFWTFEQIIYIVDCYRGEQAPLPFRRYLLFVTFFPRLIAGPIVRPRDFFASLSAWQAPISASFIAAGLTLIAIGLFKKVCLADQLALFVDPIFKHADAGSVIRARDAWAGALGFSFQIYFDFSGYSDIAIGLALLFGIRLPANFNAPYQSVSIIEFWRRWHISLSQFLRDYVYIPLGGNRRGPSTQAINIVITMGLGGLWHGAGVNFVVWGLLHGGLLVAAHRTAGLTSRLAELQIGRAAMIAATFLAVTVAWVFFRSDSLLGAKTILRAMVGNPGTGTAVAVPRIFDSALEIGLLAYCGLHCFLLPSTQTLFRTFLLVRARDATPVEQRISWRPSLRWAVLSAALFAASTWLLLESKQEFIYFQF